MAEATTSSTEWPRACRCREDLPQRGRGPPDGTLVERVVDQQHQARGAQLAGDGQARGRLQAGAGERLLVVDLRAGAGEAGHAAGRNLGHDAVAAIAGPEVVGAQEGLVLVVGVIDLERWPWNAEEILNGKQPAA